MSTHSLNRPTDCVFNGPQLREATLNDFWQWAMADLCDDDVKGFFAEWLIHKLLGVASNRRVSWANNDLVTASNVTVEIKATSYWQSWKVLNASGEPLAKRRYGATDESAIRFNGLRARDSTSVVDMSTERGLKSQIYVFAFQHETDIVRWNAMDLDQWEFYVLRSEEIARLASGSSVSLKKLRSVQTPLAAAEFVGVASNLIQTVAAERIA